MIEPTSAHRSWLERLSVLGQDRARGAAPHKPLLLLVVLNLIEEGKIVHGLIVRDGNLALRLSSYWTIIAQGMAMAAALVTVYWAHFGHFLVPIFLSTRPTRAPGWRDKNMGTRRWEGQAGLARILG